MKRERCLGTPDRRLRGLLTTSLCVCLAALALSCETGGKGIAKPEGPGAELVAPVREAAKPTKPALAEPDKGVRGQDVYLEGAAFRKVSASDPGTLLLYAGNAGNSPATLQEVLLNGERLRMVAPADAGYLHWQMRPQVVPPGGVAELAVKLSQSRVGLLNVAMTLGDGEARTISCVLTRRKEPLVITYVGFSRPLDAAYLYVRNDGETAVTLGRVWRDRLEVTGEARILDASLEPGRKTCIVLRPAVPFRPGEEAFFKVDTAEGLGARALVRAFHLFPIAAWDHPGETDTGSLGFDDDEEDTGSHLREVLACPMHAHGSWAQAARLAITKSHASGEGSRAPTGLVNSIYICRFQVERGLPLFGAVTDVLNFNPNQDVGSSGPRSRSVGYLTDLGRRCAAPRPILTRFRSSLSQGGPPHEEARPSAEEICLQTYCALAHGSKGVAYPLDGVAQESLGAIERLNANLARVKRYLAIADVLGAAATEHEKVEVAALLAGDEALLLVVLNHKYTTGEGAEESAFEYVAQRGVRVEVQVPRWFTVGRVVEAVEGEFEDTEYSLRDGKIELVLDEVGAPRLFLVTAGK